MSHLTEKTAEFVLGELSAAEMAEAGKHLAGCASCRNDVEQFQRTHTMLRSLPDVEPPRRIIFEAEKRARTWRWLVPAGAAAAVVLAVLLASPMQVQWRDSQLTIAFGRIPDPVVSQPVVVRETVAQPVDYDRIIAAVQQSQQEWLAREFRIRDAARNRDLQQISAQFAWVDEKQRAARLDTLDNSMAIELLARNDSED